MEIKTLTLTRPDVIFPLSVKKRAFFICSLLFLSTSLQARTASFNAQNFKPATDSGRYFGVYGSQVIGPRQFSLGLTTDYARSPIGLFNAAGVKIQNIIEREMALHLSGTYGFLDWLDAGLLISSAPHLVFRPLDVAATAVDESATPETRVRMGDVLLNSRLRILDNKTYPVGLSFIPMISLPTGSGASFVGNNQFAGGGLLVVESPRIADRFSVALNTGYEIRKRAVLSTGTVVNDLFLYGLAGNLSVHEKVDLAAEMRGFTMVGDLFGAQRPFEWEAGVHYRPVKDWTVTVGGGTGLIEGIGNPMVRILAGVAYHPERKPREPKPVEEPKVEKPKKKKKERLTREQKGDTDGDGIQNKDDLCPTEVGPVDNGGCPVRPKIVINPEEYRIFTRPIHFNFNRSNLHKDALPILRTLADALKSKPTILLLSVEGHTDELGRKKLNQWLSEQRADAVREFLISEGIEPSRLQAVGFGESKPLVQGHNKKAWKRNRRVEFVFKEVDGLVIPEEIIQTQQPTLPESGPVTVPSIPPPADLPSQPTTPEVTPPSETTE